ncbi:MAG TPA: hypothetical protein PK509_07965, partial [Catalimonadaceae bacterium]|nr:hypothetical protein [Catalimonadaceae bacterium]
PDSNSKPLKIALNSILLKDIRLVYDDAVTGMLANAQLGELSLKMEETDFQNMRFKGDELMLSNSTGFFHIRKTDTNPDEPSSNSLLPELALRKINLKAVNFGFHNLPDSSFFDFQIGQISIEPKTIDLNKENIELKTVLIHESDIRISMQDKPQNPKSAQTNSSSQNQWKASIAHLDLDKNHFQYEISNVPVLNSGIDYNHLDLDQLHLTARNLRYSPQIIKGQIEQLSLLERCGLKLEKFETRFEYDSTHARLENLFVQTDKSRISAQLDIEYPSISSLSTQIGKLEMHANLDSCRISMKDVLQFAPDLIRQQIIQKNKDQVILTDGIVDGLVSNLRVQKLDVQTATNTRISLNGQLKGLPDPNRLSFNLRLNKLVSSRSDLNQLLPADMLPNSVRIPDRFSV